MLAAGTRVGEHVIVRRVAVGATSEVYAGRHEARGEPVAVKVLSPEWCVHAEVVARFLNEARRLRELRHPHLVRALDSGVLEDGPPFIVLEWLPVDLHQVLARAGGRLPLEDCVRVLRQLADVLAALHEQGLIHRDLKPANVLLAREEPGAVEVKLADLGLARQVPGEGPVPSVLPVSTADSALLGTGEYMAPEQWVRAKSVSSKVDVYALGVLGFELLTGRLPFLGEPKELMFLHLLEPPPLHLLEDKASEPVRELVSRMLRKKAAERPEPRDILAGLARAGG